MSHFLLWKPEKPFPYKWPHSPSGSAKRQSMIPTKPTAAKANPVAPANTNNTNPTAMPRALSNLFKGMSRLTPARDLTLGGRGGATNKKVFAPNLNAVRNKNVNVKTSKDCTQPRGGRRGARGAGGTARGRGAGNSNSNLIQTTGVFSEGTGPAHIRKSSAGLLYARGGDEVCISRKRKDDKEEDQRVKDLICDDSEDDDFEEDENDKTELTFKPVMLKEGLWNTQKLNIKEEAEDKPKQNLNETDTLAVAQHLQSLHVAMQIGAEEPPAQYERYPRSIGAFLDKPQSQLFIMQLPNVLPCVADDDEEPASAIDKPPMDSQQNSPTPTPGLSGTSKPSLLSQLEEGQIGKVLRYRSGRVKLQLGETLFDLDLGLDPGFLQEVMSVSCNREQRSGSMINLGAIQAKLTATPDWVHLFEQLETAPRQPKSTTSNLPTVATGPAAT